MEDWKEVKLGDIAVLNYGKALRQIDRKEGNIPVYSSAGLTGFHNKPMVDSKGIIIGRKGTIGKIFKTEVPFCCIDTAYYIIPNDEKYNFDFFFYRLKTLNLEELNSDSAVPGLNRNIAYDQKLLLPPLPEQRAIAAVLSSLDDKIDLLHRQNETLEAMAETLFREWFVEQADEDWEEGTLGDVIETTSGGTPSRKNMGFYENGTINWVKSKELNGSFIFETEELITEEALKKSSAKILPKNSILIAMYGATVGKYAVISKEMTCNQAICALKPNKDYPYTFLFLYIKRNKEDIMSMSIGSAQQNISQLLIKQLPIINRVDKIQEFHQIVEPYFNKIKNNSIQIRTLTQLRDTLLPKLMSGEIRIKETEVITD